jgi:hypothetical protein
MVDACILKNWWTLFNMHVARAESLIQCAVRLGSYLAMIFRRGSHRSFG